MRIGIDLGGTKTEVIALSDQGEQLFRHRLPTPREDYRQTIETIATLVAMAEQATGQQGTVGMGIPGSISPYTGVVKNANSTWLNGQPFDKDLSLRLEREVRLANDANCLAVSEAVDGAAAGAQTVFAVIIGTGCGAGVALNGRAHIGGNGNAGEWGHNPLPWMNDDELRYRAEVPCYCGKQGCIETFISGTGFATDYQRLSGKGLTGSEIMRLVGEGDEKAELALSRYEQRLAKSLAHVVNILDPDVIVLGGGMSNVERLYQTVPDLVKQWVFGGECETPIRKAMHGDSSGVRGAAGCGRSRGPEPLPRTRALSRGRGLGCGDIAIIQTSLHRKRFVQPAIAQAVNLLHFDLHRNAVFHRLHVADHPDNLTAGVKGIQGVQGRVQRFAVEGAEAFIKKQGVNPRLMAHQV